MPNSLPQLHCPNIRCRAVNTDRDQFCQKCGTYLPKRFLWVVGSRADLFQVGDTLAERFLFRGPRVVFDTQPGLPLKMDVELPDTLVPYLKLFPYRLHIPQIYTLLALEAAEPSLLLLLEHAPLGNSDLAASEQGGISIGTGITLFDAWSTTPPLRQLHWLWQIAQLWQPLRIQGVASSLLQPDFLRVEGQLLRLLELENDFRLEPSLADLGQVWQQLIPKTNGKLATSLDTLCEQLASGSVASAEELLVQLESWIDNIHNAYRIKIDIATRTDTGMVREHNEDACYPADGAVTQNSMERMAIVCDGVGGHAGGEVASGIAIEALRSHLTQLPIDTLSSTEVITELENASFKANDLICQRNDQEQRQDRQRMGTTLVTALSQTHQIYISHIGDSRAYLITSQGCYQIMVDDDIASREVRLGYVPYREALMQPASGSLVQALGMASSSILRPTVQRFLLDEDCLFLLCSDGLSDYDRVEMIWREELLPLLQGGTDLASASKRLIELANQLNGHDNVTVGLIHCHVIRQRDHSKSASSEGLSASPSPHPVPPSSPPATELPQTQTQAVDLASPPQRKRGVGGLLLLILGLLLLGGGVAAYKLGLFNQLPFFNTPKAANPPAPPPPNIDSPKTPLPGPGLATTQKTDVLRLVADNNQSIEIPVIQDIKKFAEVTDQEATNPSASNPQPSEQSPANSGAAVASTITLPSGSLVVVDGFFPVSPAKADVSLPESPIQALKLQTCRPVIGSDTKTEEPTQEGADRLAPSELLDQEGVAPTSNVLLQLPDKPPKIDASTPKKLKPQFVWIKLSTLEPLVAEIIPAAQLNGDQKKACAPPPLKGEAPAGVSVNSDSTP
ncbi:protein phosphatase 2C domain-containing protein [Acaryochloris sp. IP29b_bin.148]|uniref:protein phosphatase 2C domain-containing protein n=1 Tax=Acaryochloris sp. IP29b_bin.148 TaxID=2969218 RepID=UPI00261B8445|nr:protein phosphatase 2C domain-containing protein [Acaryochloris sp. IP29b_bin.148]